MALEPFYRQDKATELTELIGKKCQNILLVQSKITHNIIVFYVQVDNLWLRMFIDVDVLFVESCDEPDSTDDIDESHHYMDLSSMYCFSNNEIVTATIANGTFLLKIKCGTEILFKQQDDETKLYLKPR